MSSTRKKKLFKIISYYKTIELIKKEDNQVWLCKIKSAHGDNYHIASGSLDRKIKVWNTTTNACLKTFQGHEWTVSCLAYLTSKNQIASGSWDRTIKVWSTHTCECLKTFRGHTGYVKCLLELSDNKLASGSNDSTIRIWSLDLEEHNCLQTFQGYF